MKSRSEEQLKSVSSENDTSDCKPEHNAGGMPIVPCGLIAWSMFNDTYNFSRINQQLPVNKKGISWKSDRDHKFGKNVFPKNFQSGTLIGGANLSSSIPVSPPSPSIFTKMKILKIPISLSTSSLSSVGVTFKSLQAIFSHSVYPIVLAELSNL